MPKDFGPSGVITASGILQRKEIMKLYKPKQTRQKFTPADDQILLREVGDKRFPEWTEIAKKVPGKTGRQCRERYHNYLAPTISLEPWTEEEDDLLRRMFQIYGPNWAKISEHFNGKRTNNGIKNRWNNHLKSNPMRRTDTDIIETEIISMSTVTSPALPPVVHHSEPANVVPSPTQTEYEESPDDFNIDPDIWAMPTSFETTEDQLDEHSYDLFE